MQVKVNLTNLISKHTHTAKTEITPTELKLSISTKNVSGYFLIFILRTLQSKLSIKRIWDSSNGIISFERPKPLDPVNNSTITPTQQETTSQCNLIHISKNIILGLKLSMCYETDWVNKWATKSKYAYIQENRHCTSHYIIHVRLIFGLKSIIHHSRKDKL